MFINFYTKFQTIFFFDITTVKKFLTFNLLIVDNNNLKELQ